MASKEELGKLKVSELQNQLDSLGLDTNGKKGELVERLWAVMSQEGNGIASIQDSRSDEAAGVDKKQVESAQAILTKLKLLKERQTIEVQQVRMKARVEQIELEMKLAEVSGETIDKETIDSVRVTAESGESKCEESMLLSSYIQRSLLPPSELKPFSGDVVEYRLWIRSFQARIGSRTKDELELLHFLDQYTTGVANQLVRSCMYLPKDGFAQALKLLEERYGNSHRVIDEYSNRLREMPEIKPDDVNAMDRLLLMLREISNVMSDIEGSEFDHPSSIRQILAKMPSWLQDRFLRKIDSLEQSGKRVKLWDVIQFLETEVRVKRNPLFGPSKVSDAVTGRSDSRAGGASHVPSHRVNAIAGIDRQQRCSCCNSDHFVGSCDQLRFKTVEDRHKFIRDKQLCFGCLRTGHLSRSCRRRLTCDVCGGFHPTLLHRTQGASPRGRSVEPVVPQPETPTLSSGASQRPTGLISDSGPTIVNARVAVGGQHRRAYMPIVGVKVKAQSGKVVTCNAFLDSGSSGCFGTKSLAQKLGVPQRSTTVSVDTVFGERQAFQSSMMEDVQIAAIDGQKWYPLPTVFTLQKLPVTIEDRCPIQDVLEWPHLKEMKLQQVSCPVELLIGADAPHLHVATDVRSPADGVGPHGVHTVLGWYVIGVVGDGGSPPSRQLVNFLRVQESTGSHESNEDQEKDMVRRLYEQEFQDLSDDREGLSVEDKEWIEQVESNIHKDEKGHYQVGLPKSDTDNLPDSLPVAERRLSSLRRKLHKDPSLFHQYRAVIQGLVDDGYAERVPPGEAPGPVWYLPHHEVIHPEKRKVRVVFDCAAKTCGLSLNDVLKKGPNVTGSLLGVLHRFREGEIAFTCDVESMFHRVHLAPSDCDLFRFLWFQNHDLNDGVEIWRMKSHVFGAVSSPSVAGYALLQCAKDGREEYPQAAEVLVRRVYVDDALVAKGSLEEAVRTAHDLQELCRRGGFNMTKFASNSAELLKQIPPEHRGKKVSLLDLDRDEMLPEGALGMKWSVAEDAFRFEFVSNDRPVTRRGILSVVSSLFDPLGIVAPVTLVGKALLQKLCDEKCDWDDPVPNHLAAEWKRWVSDTCELAGVSLNRCITGPCGTVKSTQLHVFADASEVGYSAVAYIRKEVQTEAEGDKVFMSFLMGKCRVTPIRRVVTIPRLELAAAVLATKIRGILLRELDTPFDDIYMWSDSMVVLSYIRNRTTRFKTYVANRLAYIHGNTDVSNWHHVPSASNPADIGSRGCSPSELDGSWLSGSPFLTEDSGTWPREPKEQPEIPADEVKRSCTVAAVVLEAGNKQPCDRLIEHYSRFLKLKKAVAWYRKFFEVIKNGSFRRAVIRNRNGLRRRPVESGTRLTVADLKGAENALIRYVQKDSFPELVMPRVDGPVPVRKGTPLACLRPLMKDGIMVVGGRLRRSASLSDSQKHPAILPRSSHVTMLVVREAHLKIGHEGREHTYWKVREAFWVIGAGPMIRHMVRSCVTCRKANGLPEQQIMSDLPSERVTAGDKAFSEVSIDVMGPFLVKQGRREKKRYGLVCVCSKTRAVHLEVLASLDTDSLINGIRRITARRGEISRIRSDLGTNMVGANNALNKALKDIEFDRMHGHMLGQGIEWLYHPPTASHFGGSHERAIRSFRKIFRSLPVQRLDDESLHTLFCEVEAVLNNRPLNYVSTTQGDVEPLTPSHLLLLRGATPPVMGRFTESDSISRRRWRQVQYLSNQFWLRWLREFVPTLQIRQKWTHESRNITPGDVVLILDKDMPRGKWKMGKVTDAFTSEDGFVRKVAVRTDGTVLTRPIHKLVLILRAEDIV